jgi:hypothetical protein
MSSKIFCDILWGSGISMNGIFGQGHLQIVQTPAAIRKKAKQTRPGQTSRFGRLNLQTKKSL